MEFRLRLVTGIALVLSLSGCSFVEATLLSAGEKLNRAFPPSPQVRVAEETLRDSLSANDPFAVRYSPVHLSPVSTAPRL